MIKYFLIAICLTIYIPSSLNASVFNKQEKKQEIKEHKYIFEDKKLSQIITLISKAYGWDEIIWNASSDYYIQGKLTIKGSSFKNILQKLLKSYPIEIDLYQSNKVIVVTNEHLYEN